MKQMFVNAIASFITGFFFLLGFWVPITIWEAVDDSNYDNLHLESLDNPEKIEILRSWRLEKTDVFTIVGAAGNNSETHWENLYLQATVYVDELEINSCSSNIDRFEPNSVRGFMIECSGLKGPKLPENLTYKVKVDSGVHEPG